MFLCGHSTILVTECILDCIDCGLLVENLTVSMLQRFTQLSATWMIDLQYTHEQAVTQPVTLKLKVLSLSSSDEMWL